METNDPIVTVLLAGFSLAIVFPIATFLATSITISNRLKANIVGLASGIFLGTIAFSVMEESSKQGNYYTLIIGFAIGVLTFTLTSHFMQQKEKNKQKDKQQQNHQESKHHHQQQKQQQEKEEGGKGNNEEKESSSSSSINAKSIIVGETLDGIPEGLFVGIMIGLQIPNFISGIIASNIGNFAATVDAARDLHESGFSKKKNLKIWMILVIAIFVSTIAGYYSSQLIPKEYISIMLGFSAGALLSTTIVSLLPEGYVHNHWLGASTSFGFILSFLLFHLI
jgi:zinc transporter, ZIP family